MKPVRVRGVGLWAPGFAGVGAWMARAADPAATTPPAELLPPRLRRYASVAMRATVEALAEAARQGGADLAATPTVFGSAHGEIQTAVDILELIAREGLPTPARFMNSVHNTAAGHVAIATQNRGFSTALAAGAATAAMCLLEAMAYLDRHGGPILVAIADEPLPAPLAGAAGRFAPLGLAWHLAAAPAPSDLAALADLRREAAPVAPVPAPWAENPCAAGLPLVEAIAAGRFGPIALAPGGEDPWCADLVAPEGA